MAVRVRETVQPLTIQEGGIAPAETSYKAGEMAPLLLEGSRVDSQHPHGGSPQGIVTGHLMPSPDLPRPLYAHGALYTQANICI